MLPPKKGLFMISIVIPTLNEEGNIIRLLERIDQSCKRSHIPYEVIIVDDHSTDRTLSLVRKKKNRFHVKIYSKKGEKGKAFSLLEGFTHASGEIIGFIDADLQYPPEAINEMYEILQERKVDIVVANRNESQLVWYRRIFSKTFNFIFVKVLHHIPCDAQSGLKLFRKEILEQITIHPRPWSFDLEFLVKALDAGFLLSTIPITFSPRTKGISKIHLFSDSLQIAREAIKLKLKKRQPIQNSSHNGFHYKGKEFTHYSSLPFYELALTHFTRWQKTTILLIFCTISLFILLNWHVTLIIFIATITVLYFVDLVCNTLLVSLSFLVSPILHISSTRTKKTFDYPIYTIFCPLYKESEIVGQFIEAMQNLDYPQEKLDIMLLLEENDPETIEQISMMHLPENFSIHIVPHSFPKTKPKALNYALEKARGEYAVIYDAEDIPDPDQLKKAIIAFQTMDKSVVCIQAKLNYYNAKQNLLTRLFTAEYAVWFELILTGLQYLQAPIPLGGTSNHFKLNDLKKLSGWDPFNVTEDADLGMRIAKRGYHTAIIDSYTLEEANCKLKNWRNQRARWMKGYMQTYFVHMRNPKDFFGKGFFLFQLMIGGKVFATLANLAMWIMTSIYIIDRGSLHNFIHTLFPGPILYIAVITFVFGNFLYLYSYTLGLVKRGQWDLIPFTLLVPFYWFFMSIACLQACKEFIFNLHHWNKTKHGLYLQTSQHVALQQYPLTHSQ